MELKRKTHRILFTLLILLICLKFLKDVKKTKEAANRKEKTKKKQTKDKHRLFSPPKKQCFALISKKFTGKK